MEQKAPVVPPSEFHILDMRPRESFLALHHCRSSHFYPLGEFKDRLFELPPPQRGPEPPVNLVLVHQVTDELSMEQVVRTLQSVGYTVVERVTDLEQRFPKSELASGKQFFCLWQPNPALEKCWEVILAKHPPGAKRLCLDLAAGNGRDLVFCARAGFTGVGIDYMERQWSKMDALAARALAELPDEELQRFGSVRSSNMNLETEPLAATVDKVLQDVMRGERATLLIVSRYLHRPLFPHLHKLVEPGGLLLFHTFMEGADKVGRKTPTRPRFLLKEGELRTAFEEHFIVLEDSILLLPDERPTSCFLAQKKKYT